MDLYQISELNCNILNRKNSKFKYLRTITVYPLECSEGTIRKCYIYEIGIAHEQAFQIKKISTDYYVSCYLNKNIKL